MYRILYRFEGKPAVTADYRGTEPIKTYATRQRSIYRADQVEVFDESGTLVCRVGPKPKRRTAAKAAPEDKRRRPIKRRLQPAET
jgi:hypothetical protein